MTNIFNLIIITNMKTDVDNNRMHNFDQVKNVFSYMDGASWENVGIDVFLMYPSVFYSTQN